MMSLAELCVIASHAGHRYYTAGHFGCDACESVAVAS
jgi:hypothetical protein